MTPSPAGDLDPRDLDIRAKRQAALDAKDGLRVGDWVEFSDQVVRRISHIWPDGVQTSDSGSFYLGEGFVSMSGSLYSMVPKSSLTKTDQTRDGSVWFFHHDYATAHNGVQTSILFRVYTCSLPAPR
jgi:hypothetical protein